VPPETTIEDMTTRHVRLLVLSLLVVLGLSPVLTPSAGATPAAPSRSLQTAMVLDGVLEQQVLTLTNRRRAAHGCAPVRFNRNLRSAARKHTFAMARARTMSHQLPGEPRLGRRATLANYLNWQIVAENIAVGFATAGGVVRAWMASPSHRRNILDCRLRELGVGVVHSGGRLWWTQNFGRR
jgi:uncharacterized protein YkwD